MKKCPHCKQSMVRIGKGMKLKRGEERKLRAKPGGGSVGKYKNVAKKDFAGPKGGSPKGSFPVQDIRHARNALARAHFAPNPAGIRAAVYRKYPELKKRHEARTKGKK